MKRLSLIVLVILVVVFSSDPVYSKFTISPGLGLRNQYGELDIFGRLSAKYAEFSQSWLSQLFFFVEVNSTGKQRLFEEHNYLFAQDPYLDITFLVEFAKCYNHGTFSTLLDFGIGLRSFIKISEFKYYDPSDNQDESDYDVLIVESIPLIVGYGVVTEAFNAIVNLIWDVGYGVINFSEGYDSKLVKTESEGDNLLFTSYGVLVRLRHETSYISFIEAITFSGEVLYSNVDLLSLNKSYHFNEFGVDVKILTEYYLNIGSSMSLIQDNLVVKSYVEVPISL